MVRVRTGLAFLETNFPTQKNFPTQNSYNPRNVSTALFVTAKTGNNKNKVMQFAVLPHAGIPCIH